MQAMLQTLNSMQPNQ
jgi:hypothetical protein